MFWKPQKLTNLHILTINRIYIYYGVQNPNEVQRKSATWYIILVESITFDDFRNVSFHFGKLLRSIKCKRLIAFNLSFVGFCLHMSCQSSKRLTPEILSIQFREMKCYQTGCYFLFIINIFLLYICISCFHEANTIITSHVTFHYYEF